YRLYKGNGSTFKFVHGYAQYFLRPGYTRPLLYWLHTRRFGYSAGDYAGRSGHIQAGNGTIV
ncbi:MAG: hypothetical protein HOG73_02085, partial [Candidatus Marinimicrobia bacterium]|nr:hypothetical protein [Candidatus Neomarinimicrobiota bacterium]